MERNEEELTPQEKALFEGLSRAQDPPARIEEEIIRQLKNEGLMTTTRTMKRPAYWLAAASIAVVAFFSGLFYGQSQAPQALIDPQQGYMLLLHEPSTFQPGDPMEMFQEYGAWMQSTEEQGVTITGQELALTTQYVSLAGISGDSDGKVFPTTGYFIVEAASMQEAVAIAQKNPHVKYGGEIEVKPFMIR